MKIILPHRTVVIREEQKLLSNEDKVAFVNEILNEEVIIRNKKMTIEEYFYSNFNNQSVIIALDMFGYFIAKKHKAYQDIMTRKTIGKMTKGDGKTFNFSNLGYNDNLKLGIIDDASEIGYN